MDELEKYIRSNGKLPREDMRKELISQGYRPEDFEHIFNTLDSENNMRKKYYLLIVLVLIIALLIRFFIINPITLSDEKSVPTEILSYPNNKYSSDPKDWIDENSNLDIVAATNGSGYMDSENIQYNDGDIMTVFSLEGYYQGNYFEKKYTVNDTVFIEITENFNSEDGIPQIMIVEKPIKENNSSIVQIFVDRDWKEKIVPTYIWWGINYENNRIFDYNNEISEGIFMDTIEDSKRFIEGFNVHFGGIAVGDITQQKIDNEETNVTYVRIR